MNKSLALLVAIIFINVAASQAQTYQDPKIPVILASERDHLPVDGAAFRDRGHPCPVPWECGYGFPSYQ
jgi:hypothetical protein